MNFYMHHSKEGDVKIYSEAEIVSMLSKYFCNVSWEQIGNTACIAMGITFIRPNLYFEPMLVV